jgi:hypothetical protein
MTTPPAAPRSLCVQVSCFFIPFPALLCDANMSTGETKGRRENACAPARPCAVFLLARIRHWNRDRGCERAQLAAVL